MTRTNISRLAEEIENVYAGYQIPKMGGLHLPISDAVYIMENRANILPETAYALLLSNQLWLPDPLYSLFSTKATTLWKKIPEGGANNFSSTPLITIEWKNYWLTKITERANFLNKIVPNLVKNLLGVKELVKNKFVLIYPWEYFLYDNLDNIKLSITELKNIKEIEKSITEHYTQKNYSLGVRLGALGIEASMDSTDHNLKKGDPLWIGDKTEIYFIGIVNTLLTSTLQSNMYEILPGDRLIHDYIRSGGRITPIQNLFRIEKEIPDLKSAVWDDIVAIKKDSELLNKMKDIITEFSYGNDENLNQDLKDRLLEIASEICNNKDLIKYFKGPLIQLGVGTLGGIIANTISGLDSTVAIATSSIIAGSSFLYSLVSEIYKKENKEKRKRKDIILKIANKI